MRRVRYTRFAGTRYTRVASRVTRARLLPRLDLLRGHGDWPVIGGSAGQGVHPGNGNAASENAIETHRKHTTREVGPGSRPSVAPPRRRNRPDRVRVADDDDRDGITKSVCDMGDLPPQQPLSM